MCGFLERFVSGKAMLDVFLTRVVMASSQEGGKEAYTTGPLIPLFHGDELLQVRSGSVLFAQ